MGTAVGAVVEIISDDEKEIAAAVKPPGDVDALGWASHLLLEDFKGFGEGLDDSAAIQEFLASLEGETRSACDAAAGGGGDDDDCVMLDGDPVKVVLVAKKRPGECGSEEELQIVAEKGEVACRDFPHPRHLCASLPFRTSSRANHCTMCHCYVCDSPAPCPNWGKGTLPSDHCHATDKDEKWKKLRQSFKHKTLPPSKPGSVKKSIRSRSTSSSQQYAGYQVSVPQPFPPLGTTINQLSAARVPVTSNVSQNQQMLPSIRAAQNVGQVVHLPKTSAPGPKISGTRFKRSGAALTVCKPSNAYSLNRALLKDVPLHPASSRVFQMAQVASGSNTIAGPIQGSPPQHSRSAPVISQGLQVQPTFQVAPNIAVGTGLQLLQCSALTTQGTQCAQDQLAIQKSWQVALANLASELGVSDYNINPPHGQQSASTQSLDPSQLLAQVKASQGGEPHRGHVSARPQMRPSNGHCLPNTKSGDSAVALCLLNSDSILNISEASLNSFVAKPATRH